MYFLVTLCFVVVILSKAGSPGMFILDHIKNHQHCHSEIPSRPSLWLAYLLTLTHILSHFLAALIWCYSLTPAFYLLDHPVLNLLHRRSKIPVDFKLEYVPFQKYKRTCLKGGF